MCNAASPLMVCPVLSTSVRPIVSNNSEIGVQASHFAHGVSTSISQLPFVSVSQHPPILPAILPVGSECTVIVGGVCVVATNSLLQLQSQPQKHGNGQRGRDNKPRESRTCQVCMKNNRCELAKTCQGRGPRGKCQYQQ